MSQTLDCEFVWKHFTTLCLHRAVGDPTSRYSALWFPKQIEGGRGEEREKLNAFLRQTLRGKMQNSVLESQSRAVSSTSSPIYHGNEKGLQSLAEKENSSYLDVAMHEGLSDWDPRCS